MAQAAQKKIRPPRYGEMVVSFNSKLKQSQPMYIQLLNKMEIEDFKQAFPNMVDFIGPDGKVRLPTSPDVRVRSIYAYHDKQTAHKYIMRMLNKFKMRGLTQDQIAQLFDVNVRTVARWYQELKQHYIQGSRDIEIQHLVGETVEYFGEIGSAAMREMDAATNPAHKARLLETALKSKEATITFLDRAGFFVNNQMTADDSEDKGRQAAIDVGNAIVSLLEGKSVEEFSREVLGTATPDIDALKKKYADVVS